MPTALLATDCPDIVVETDYPTLADAYNTAGTGVLAARNFVAGSTTLSAKLNENANRLDLASTYGGGGSAFALLTGLAISAGTGLNVAVSAGLAAIGGAVEYAGGNLAVPSSDTVWVWLQQSGALAYTTDTTPPATRCVFLGRAVTDGSGVTAVDTSGVLYLRGMALWRETSDVGKPTDTPPASVSFYIQTLGGVYLWDGSEYKTVVQEVHRRAVSYSSDANKTLSANEYDGEIIDIGSGTSLTATRNLVFPLTFVRKMWLVVNNSTGGQSVQCIGATGTGVTIATGKAAWVWTNGTNFYRGSADVTP